MVYTIEEKKKMDDIARVFSQYVADSREIDLAYTEKTGYIRLIIEEYADPVFFPIADAEDLLEMFIYDNFEDELVRCGYYGGESCPDTLEEIYAQLHKKISSLEDPSWALAFLESSWKRKLDRLNKTDALCDKP